MSSHSEPDSDDDRLFIDLGAGEDLCDDEEKLEKSNATRESNIASKNRKASNKNKRTNEREEVVRDFLGGVESGLPVSAGNGFGICSVQGPSTHDCPKNNRKTNTKVRFNVRSNNYKSHQTQDISEKRSNDSPSKNMVIDLRTNGQEINRNENELRNMMVKDSIMHITNMWHTFSDIRDRLTSISHFIDDSTMHYLLTDQQPSYVTEEAQTSIYENAQEAHSFSDQLNKRIPSTLQSHSIARDQMNFTMSQMSTLRSTITTNLCEIERNFFEFLRDCELRMECSSIVEGISTQYPQDHNLQSQNRIVHFSRTDRGKLPPSYQESCRQQRYAETRRLTTNPTPPQSTVAGPEVIISPPEAAPLDCNQRKRRRQTPMMQENVPRPLFTPAPQFQDYSFITNKGTQLPQPILPSTGPYVHVNSFNPYILQNQFISQPIINYTSTNMTPQPSIPLLANQKKVNSSAFAGVTKAPPYNAPYIHVGNELPVPQSQVNDFQYLFITQPIIPSVQNESQKQQEIISTKATKENERSRISTSENQI